MTYPRRLPFALGAFLLVGSLPRTALAGPPLLSDDPDTPGDRHWEVNVDARTTWTRRVLDVEGPTLDVNYGLGERWQLKFEIPCVYEKQDDEGARSGVGSATFGAKWRFLDQDDHGFSMSVYPQLQVPRLASLPHGTENERGVTTILPFQVQHEFEAWTLGADGGRRCGHTEGSWFGSLWVGREIRQGLELFGELHAEVPDRGDTSLIADLGAKCALDEHASLLFSAGYDLLSADGEGHAVTVFLGLQFNF